MDREILARLARLASTRVYGIEISVNEDLVFVDSYGDPVCDDGVQIRTPSDLREFTQAAFYAAATAKAQEIERNQEPASD